MMRSVIAPSLRYIAKRQVSRVDGIIIGTIQVALSFGDIKGKILKQQGRKQTPLQKLLL